MPGQMTTGIIILLLLGMLALNPPAAFLLMTRRLEVLDRTHLNIEDPLIVLVVELAGWLLYVAGFVLTPWALFRLGRYYQLRESAPRSQDRIATDGHYSMARHPTYAATLSISIGLAFLCVFCIYLVLIFRLIPMAEDMLLKAYGDQYVAYQRQTRGLVFFLPVSSRDI